MQNVTDELAAFGDWLRFLSDIPCISLFLIAIF